LFLGKPNCPSTASFAETQPHPEIRRSMLDLLSWLNSGASVAVLIFMSV
jgi:hypothetical protein